MKKIGVLLVLLLLFVGCGGNKSSENVGSENKVVLENPVENSEFKVEKEPNSEGATILISDKSGLDRLAYYSKCGYIGAHTKESYLKVNSKDDKISGIKFLRNDNGKLIHYKENEPFVRITLVEDSGTTTIWVSNTNAGEELKKHLDNKDKGLVDYVIKVAKDNGFKLDSNAVEGTELTVDLLIERAKNKFKNPSDKYLSVINELSKAKSGSEIFGITGRYNLDKDFIREEALEIATLADRLSKMDEIKTNTENEFKQYHEARENKIESIKKYFSAFDGSNRELIERTKKAMHNPKSFEHVQTRWSYNDSDDTVMITMEFRGTNALGALITETTTAKMDVKTGALK